METLSRDMQRVLSSLPDEMDKALRQPARRYVKNACSILRTPADIYDHSSHYSFVLDMPGLQIQDIKIENGILHVVGKKKKKKALEDSMAGNERAKPIRIERRRARYMRKFTLPPDANTEDVKATYKDGVLSVTVAKKRREQPPKPKTVTIPIA